jgi:hypothetical protein
MRSNGETPEKMEKNIIRMGENNGEMEKLETALQISPFGQVMKVLFS